MKSIFIYLATFLLFGLALPSDITGQQRITLSPTYQFEFKKEANGDTVSTLYCVMKVADILYFEKIYISYNDKTKQFTTRNLLKAKSGDYKIEDNLIYFKINEELEEPFVIIEGEDKSGKKYNINERNAMGKIVDSKKGKENWKKSMARIDSMDYVRQYDGVYKGRDGKPRFKDKQGKVYIIEKDHIKPE